MRNASLVQRRPWLSIAGAFAVLAAAPLQAQSGSPGRILGQVIDHQNGRPLADVAITLEGTDNRATTDRGGRFELSAVPPGEHAIVAERIGYESRSFDFRLESGAILDVQIVLATRPVELAPISVEARSQWLISQGFYDRRDGGSSATFITRPEIEARSPLNLQDVLKNVRSVRFNHVEAGRVNIRFNRMTTDRHGPALSPRTPPPVFPGCEPDLYLDGQRYRDRNTKDPNRPWESFVDNINFIPPEQIEAIEVFVGNPPIRFQSPCGVLLIWTRRGG